MRYFRNYFYNGIGRDDKFLAQWWHIPNLLPYHFRNLHIIETYTHSYSKPTPRYSCIKFSSSVVKVAENKTMQVLFNNSTITNTTATVHYTGESV